MSLRHGPDRLIALVIFIAFAQGATDVQIRIWGFRNITPSSAVPWEWRHRFDLKDPENKACPHASGASIGTYTQRHLSLLVGSPRIARDLTNCLIGYFRLAVTNFRMMSGLLGARGVHAQNCI